MEIIKKFFAVLAVVLLIMAVFACGNKSDMELSLDEDAQAETMETTGPEGSETSQTGGSLESGGADPQSVNSVPETAVQDGPIFVHICGAVRNPDVYEVPCDARVIDVVKMAGGFTDEADSDYHNLAGGVADGQKIYVPTEQEVADGLVPAPELNTVFIPGTNMTSEAGAEPGTDMTSETSDKVNINTATAEELKTLNGIGDKRAQDIIDYRTSNGKFKTIEDIKKVDGIKDGIFKKICDDITV